MLHTIKRVFFWLSGAGTETLENCPNWEQRKYVAFGATVLVPALFAFIACSYALSTLTENSRVVYPVAVVWSFIILSIDRALLASYRPYLSFFRKIGQFSLRFVVAFLMGLTIAHPLVLLLFRDTVRSVIEKDRAVEIEAARASFGTEKQKVRAEIDKLEAGIAEQREKWAQSFKADFILQGSADATAAIRGLSPEQQAELKKSTDEATAPFNGRLKTVETQITELTPTYAKLNTEMQFWQSEFERELNGQRSGLVGEGPRAKSIRSDQLEPRREEAKRLSGILQHLTVEKKSLETQVRTAEKDAVAAFEARIAEIEASNKAEADRVTTLKRRVEEDQAASFTTQQNGLRETLKQQIDTRLGELARVQQDLARVATGENQRIDGINAEPRRDILTQTLALHRLFNAGDQGGLFAIYTYLILTALFMLVDTIPLIVKFFTKAGPYDTLLDRDEVSFDSEHKSFLHSHRRYMDQLGAGNMIAITRNKRLETALVDGVEHSRAAREFLDSLIEMEKSFAEKIRLEQEAAHVGSPESVAALEAMKQRFYEELHHRMATFFARPAT